MMAAGGRLMPSPFPGMNPYLERAAVWNDFHDGYLHKLRAALAAQVLPRYFVRVGDHVYLRELPEPRAVLIGHPDLNIPTQNPAPTGEPAAVAQAPVSVELFEQLDEERA